MKWYIIGGIFVIAIVVVSFLILSSLENLSAIQDTDTSVTGSTVPSTQTVPSSQSSTGKPPLSLSTRDGGVTSKDFIHNGETVEDVVNPGSYVLAGSLGYCLADGSCPSGADTADFSIVYNEPTDFFRIILLKEPLGEARSAAEAFLLDRLGITEQQACSLEYVVGTPYWVNATYDSKNLGFSFCPGATVLPK